jgi:hypothetical protein
MRSRADEQRQITASLADQARLACVAAPLTARPAGIEVRFAGAQCALERSSSKENTMMKLVTLSSLLLAACATEPQTDPTLSIEQMIGINDCPADIPTAIAPAADQDLAFVLDARGTQNYACSTAGAWVFVGPDAEVYRDNQTFIHHYAGPTGPTWEWLDGSTVVGARVAGVTVDATAIPWLLLRAASHGPIEGKMTEISAVQRVHTTGGLAPAGTCTPGDTANVPYTAVYLFYRTKTDHPENNTRCGA